MHAYLDGEVLGIDNDSNVILWDADKEKRYNCGETINQYGINNLTDKEKHRLNLLKTKMLKDNDWDCPHCGGKNNTERPDKVVQCSWCMKYSINTSHKE
jgi:hypothetical protein